MLRHYDEEGLLSPPACPMGIVRIQKDVKRLAGILAMRSCGLSYAKLKLPFRRLFTVFRSSSRTSPICTQERESHEAIGIKMKARRSRVSKG